MNFKVLISTCFIGSIILQYKRWGEWNRHTYFFRKCDKILLNVSMVFEAIWFNTDKVLELLIKVVTVVILHMRSEFTYKLLYFSIRGGIDITSAWGFIKQARCLVWEVSHQEKWSSISSYLNQYFSLVHSCNIVHFIIS